MKTFIVLALCVCYASAGFLGGLGGGSNSGWSSGNSAPQVKIVKIIQADHGHSNHGSGHGSSHGAPDEIIKVIKVHGHSAPAPPPVKIIKVIDGGHAAPPPPPPQVIKVIKVHQAPENNGWQQPQNNGWQQSGW